MSDNNEVLFEEKQNQPLYMRLGIPLVMLAVTAWVHFSDPSSDIWITVSVAPILLLIAVVITTPKLVTEVDSNSVSIRKRFVIFVEIPFQNINKAEEASYKDAISNYGQFSLFASAAYLYLGDQGVLINHNEGKLTFVSSKRAEELVAAIQDGRQKYEQSKYV